MKKGKLMTKRGRQNYLYLLPHGEENYFTVWCWDCGFSGQRATRWIDVEYSLVFFA